MAPHWTGLIIVGLLLFVLFGRGKISALMGDVAKGVTAFRKGLKDGDEESDDTKSETRTESLSSDAETSAEARREDERAGS